MANFEKVQNRRGNHRKWEVFNPTIPPGSMAVVHFTTAAELVALKAQLAQLTTEGKNTTGVSAASVQNLSDFELANAGRTREVRVAPYKVDAQEIGTKFKDCEIIPIWYNPGNPDGLTPNGKSGRDFDNPGGATMTHNYVDFMTYVNKHLFKYEAPLASITLSQGGPLTAGTIIPAFNVTLTGTPRSFPLSSLDLKESTPGHTADLVSATSGTSVQKSFVDFILDPTPGLKNWAPVVTGAYTYGMKRSFYGTVQDNRPAASGTPSTVPASATIESYYPTIYLKTGEVEGLEILAMLNEGGRTYDEPGIGAVPVEEIFYRRGVHRVAGPSAFQIPALDLRQEMLFIVVPREFPNITQLMQVSAIPLNFGTATDVFSQTEGKPAIEPYGFNLASSDSTATFKKWSGVPYLVYATRGGQTINFPINVSF